MYVEANHKAIFFSVGNFEFSFLIEKKTGKACAFFFFSNFWEFKFINYVKSVYNYTIKYIYINVEPFDGTKKSRTTKTWFTCFFKTPYYGETTKNSSKFHHYLPIQLQSVTAKPGTEIESIFPQTAARKTSQT